MSHSLAERMGGFFKFFGKKSTEGQEGARGSVAEGIEKTKKGALNTILTVSFNKSIAQIQSDIDLGKSREDIIKGLSFKVHKPN